MLVSSDCFFLIAGTTKVINLTIGTSCKLVGFVMSVDDERICYHGNQLLTLTNCYNYKNYTSQTNPKGYYCFESIPKGNYCLKVGNSTRIINLLDPENYENIHFWK